MSSSCCGGNCGCGSDRKCGSGCGGRCKMYPEEASAAATTAPTAVAPSTKGHAENDGCKCGPNCTCDPCKCGDAGSEAAGSAENDGCKCGPNCTCDPCNCGK